MEHYEIVMTPDSIKDLSDLRNYVADVLLARETALKLIGIFVMRYLNCQKCPVE